MGVVIRSGATRLERSTSRWYAPVVSSRSGEGVRFLREVVAPHLDSLAAQPGEVGGEAHQRRVHLGAADASGAA